MREHVARNGEGPCIIHAIGRHQDGWRCIQGRHQMGTNVNIIIDTSYILLNGGFRSVAALPAVTHTALIAHTI
jgi:hypothetical protein